MKPDSRQNNSFLDPALKVGVSHSSITPKVTPDDQVLDNTLRPRSFSEYIGQDKIKENLRIVIGAAKKRNEPVEHLLFHGPSGLGKTTLAYLVARELGTNIRITSGTALEKAGDVGSILTGLNDGDIIFIDEVHRLNKAIEEVIYPAMENFKLDIVIGKGNSAKTLQIDLPRFTLIAATTKISMLSAPFRSRFGVNFRLDFYNQKNIESIIIRSAGLLGITAEAGAVKEIAAASRFTPRVANRLLKRVRDFGQMNPVRDKTGQTSNETNSTYISAEIARDALKMLEVDERGLEETDRKILSVIVNTFNGGPVGLKSIAASISEEESTIEDVYEPYLMQIGFLARTPKGRVVTSQGLDHLGIKNKKPKLL